MTLKSMRKAAGLSLEKVSHKMDCSRETISAWEKGRSEPRLSEINKLRRIYNVTAAQILGVEKEEQE